MKKVVSILSLVAFTMCLGSYSIQAQKPTESKLKQKISNKITFPYLSQGDMEGEVSISFMVNEEGRLDVLSIDSSNKDLIPYVLRRLSKVVLPLNDATIGTTQSFKLNFKKEENRAI